MGNGGLWPLGHICARELDARGFEGRCPQAPASPPPPAQPPCFNAVQAQQGSNSSNGVDLSWASLARAPEVTPGSPGPTEGGTGAHAGTSAGPGPTMPLQPHPLGIWQATGPTLPQPEARNPTHHPLRLGPSPSLARRLANTQHEQKGLLDTRGETEALTANLRYPWNNMKGIWDGLFWPRTKLAQEWPHRRPTLTWPTILGSIVKAPGLTTDLPSKHNFL